MTGEIIKALSECGSNPRSGWKHKARGEAQRNPGMDEPKNK